MDTPHNDKQRKSLFPYKLAQTLVGLIAVCFLIFCIRSPSTFSPSPFQDDILRERNRFEMDFHNTLWRDRFLLC